MWTTSEKSKFGTCSSFWCCCSFTFLSRSLNLVWKSKCKTPWSLNSLVYTKASEKRPTWTSFFFHSSQKCIYFIKFSQALKSHLYNNSGLSLEVLGWVLMVNLSTLLEATYLGMFHIAWAMWQPNSAVTISVDIQNTL